MIKLVQSFTVFFFIDINGCCQMINCFSRFIFFFVPVCPERMANNVVGFFFYSFDPAACIEYHSIVTRQLDEHLSSRYS